MINRVRGDLAVKVFGPDLDQLNDYAAQIEGLLKTIEGNQDAYTVENDGVQYLSIAVDRLEAGQLGLSIEEIQDALRIQIEVSARALSSKEIDGRYRLAWQSGCAYLAGGVRRHSHYHK